MSDKPDPPDDGSDVLPEVLSRVNWEAIPKEQREQLQTVLHAQFEMIRSPLLPPRLLKEYDEVVPGLAVKLVEWTEAESDHRRNMEKLAFDATRSLQGKGQWFGLTVSILGLCLAALIVLLSPTKWSALVAIVVAIVSVGGPFAARFLAARFNRQSESNE